MPGVSIHVVDVSRGIVAAGMRVTFSALAADGARDICDGRISADGVLAYPVLASVFPEGRYRVLFYVADYYRAEGVAIPAMPFLDVVQFDFGIANSAQHYHLPFKCTPWGYSCFRGGA